MIDCNECRRLQVTEQIQNMLKRQRIDVDHICGKYEKRVMHRGCHPYIIPCHECNGNDFEERNINDK